MLQFSSLQRLFKKILLITLFFFAVAFIKAQNTVYQTLFTDATFSKTINTGLPVGVIDGQHGTTPTEATYKIVMK